MNLIPAPIHDLSPIPDGNVRAVDRRSNKCDAHGRLGVIAGKENSLTHGSDRHTLGIDAVDQRRVRIDLRNIGSKPARRAADR